MIDFKKEILLAARLTWNNKILWVFAAAPTLLLYIYEFGHLDVEPSTATFLQALAMCLVPCMFLLAAITLIPISVIAMVLGIYKARSGETLNLDGLFNEAREYLLKYWGLMLVFMLIGAVLATIALAIIMLVDVTGVPIFAGPTLILVYVILAPLFVWLMGLLQFSTLGLVLNKYAATEAFGNAWRLVIANLNRVLIAGFVIELLSFPISYGLQAAHEALAAPLIAPPGSTLNGILYLINVLVYVVATSMLAVFTTGLWMGLFLHVQPQQEETK